MASTSNNSVSAIADVSLPAAARSLPAGTVHCMVDLWDVPLPLPKQEEEEEEVLEERGADRTCTYLEMVRNPKRHPNSSVVRVTNISHNDWLHYRALVRRLRLTFEALRGAYQRQELQGGTKNLPYNRAYRMMLTNNMCLHHDIRIVGDIPGILVGDTFYYRNELCVVGLHNKHQAGISYVPANLMDEGVPIAISIVSSEGYLDNKDLGDLLYYSGSGGHSQNSLKHGADQTLKRGNLALHNSYVYGVEVRVIRGVDCKHNPGRKVYVYDGLYRVVSSTFGPGKSGHNICKFTLLRLSGQAELGSKSWQTAQRLKDTIDARIRPLRGGYISLDLSKGTENFRIPVCNTVNDDRSPLLFEYIVRPDFPVLSLSVPGQVEQDPGCHCATSCDSKCSCQMKNSGDGKATAYNREGILEMGRPMVYECGALCRCPMTCGNRVTQRGMKHRLEVFCSGETAGFWGVRTLDLILPGSFVCEYAGEVVAMDDHQSRNVLREDHSFIDPKMLPERWKEWGDAGAVDPAIERHEFQQFRGPGYILDVSRKRNMACYIRHSGYSPNVFFQYVVRGNEDKSFPHLMVFAMETIPPMRELTIDWGIISP